MNKAKVQQTKEVDLEELRKIEEAKLKKEEENRKKKQEYKEVSQRAQRQREQAQEVSKNFTKKKTSSFNSYYIVFAILGGLCIYVIVMLFLNQQAPLNKTPVVEDKKIDEHNQNFPWQQGANKFFEGATLADAKKIINTSFASHPNLNRCTSDETTTTPEYFDARAQWPSCMLPTGNQQRTCGSSYAFAASQTAAERLCINSKDQRLVKLSPQELISCDVANQGCKGGYLNSALDYMRGKGLVDEQCFPYQADSDTVKCDKVCPNPTSRERIEGYCILFGEEDIKKDIFKNGPVVAATQVHVDFLTYKSGVYVKGDEVPRFSGFQAIKIIGWGIESGSENEPNKGNKYWLIQNSWGEDWGENGVAKVSMGQELMFDQYAYSVKVRTDKPQEINEPKQQDNINRASAADSEENLNLDDFNADAVKDGESSEEKGEDDQEKK